MDVLEEEDKALEILMMKFDMVNVLPFFKYAQVTYRSLEFLQSDDIKEIIPPLGLRVEFREKLFAWKKEKFGIAATSMPSIKENWLNNSYDFISYPNLSPNNSSSVLNKDLKNLLMETSKGRALLEAYKTRSSLTDNNRNDLINIIVEDVMFTNKTLSTKDFCSILDEISTIFPTEKNVQKYYFIPRGGTKRNHVGKLYAKYCNSKAKKKRLGSSVAKTIALSNVPSFNENEECDESMLNALKTYLRNEGDNWTDIFDKWEKTFSLRQRDIKTMTNAEFIKAWPKYKDSRFPELFGYRSDLYKKSPKVDIDFGIMYPQKTKCLIDKWESFKEKILQFYESNIHNVYCKQLFSILKSTKDKDTQDYLTCTLLNSVLPSTSRLKNHSGKQHKKITIADAQDSFALRISSINDYQRQKEELVKKYFSNGLTIQPFLIVEGISDEELTGFYVYFDSILYKFDSFTLSLDTCFKMFHTLSQNYPKACEPLWVFIQQFIFDINTASDCKSSNLTSLLNFMNSN